MESGRSTTSSAPSVGRALDRARALIASAWDHNDRPTYLLLSPVLYARVAESKRRESQAGVGLRLLGLLVVSSPALSGDDVAVR